MGTKVNGVKQSVKKVVIILLNSFAGGGAEKTILEVFKRAKSWEVHLVLNKADGAWKPDSAEFSGRIHELKPGGALRKIFEVSGLARKLNAKIITGVLWAGNRKAAAVGLLYGIPSIISVHNNLDQKQRSVWNLMALAVSKFVVCVSEGLSVDISKNLPSLSKKLQVIHNGIDLNEINSKCSSYPVSEIAPKTEFKLITAGRLVPQKAHSVLIDAVKLIKARGHPVSLDIYGEGFLKDQLQAQIEGSKLQQTVFLRGFDHSIYIRMAESDLFVLSSEWEGLGNVILEAQACGTPVVSTDCPYGPSEIIKHGQNGWLVPVGDVNAMADAIQYFIENPEERKRIRGNALETVKSWSIDRMVENYEQLFDDLTN